MADRLADFDSRRISAKHRVYRDTSFAEGSMEVCMTSHSMPTKGKSWSPKNPEVLLPPDLEMGPLTDQEWANSRFPSFPLPASVVKNVRAPVWKEGMEGFHFDSGKFLLMWKVLEDLTLG